MYLGCRVCGARRPVNDDDSFDVATEWFAAHERGFLFCPGSAPPTVEVQVFEGAKPLPVTIHKMPGRIER